MKIHRYAHRGDKVIFLDFGPLAIVDIIDSRGNS
jgi:hypothetical protein